MYNDGVITTEFTGYYDNVAQEYVYPDAKQNLVVVFPDFYLSAEDGDFTTDGISISTQIGDSEDITIGNAPAAVLNATLLNPDGLMDGLTWGYGTAAIGVVTGTAAADTYSSLPCYVLSNTHHYGITASGGVVHDSTTSSIGGKPMAVIAYPNDTAYYFTSTGVAYWGGSSFTTPSSAAITFLADKFADREEPIGIECDSNGCPAVWNNVSADTKTTYTYVPMGIFDFSNVDAFGMTFVCEAYDKMVLFDADATDWVQSLDFTTPKTLSTLITELMTEMGLTATVSGSAVNTSITWSENPITSYAPTYRQVLKWLAEAIGCNVRMTRTGTVEFYVFTGTSVATITPNTIISNTRTKNRYTVPQITKCVCYNTVGAGYESGVNGSAYIIVANPFIDPSGADGLTPVTNLKDLLDDIPAYYPTSISLACSDPRIDTGDFLTIQSVDGLSTYVVPVMRQTLVWNNSCKATLTASGKQVRSIPNSITDSSDLSGVVSSNPAAVVNMIQAHGIDADWITAGTISDRNHLNTWDLDTGDLTITTGKIQTTYTKTYYYTDYDASDITRITNLILGSVTPTEEDYEKYDIDGSGYFRVLDMVRVQGMIDDQVNLTKTITTTIDPSVNNKAIAIRVQVPAVGMAAALDRTATYAVSQVNVNTITCSDLNASNAYIDDLIVKDPVDKNSIEINGNNLRFWDANGNIVKTITASGPTPSTGYGSQSVASDANYHTSGSFTISDPGTYMVCVHATFASNSGTGRRGLLLSYSQDSSTAISSLFAINQRAVDGTYTNMNLCGVLTLSSSTKYYINAQQNSGSSMTVNYSYSYVRLA